jgi:hypothetical protein
MADIHPRERLFDAGPCLTVHDPLAELLGAGDGTWTYTFDDAVRLAGHACPTVAGAYVTAVQAVLKGAADAIARARFRWAWRDRVERIVADGGESTVREVPEP